MFAVSLFTILGLMAIWQWIGSDILYKSFSTIGVLAFAALVVVGISRVSRLYSTPAPVVAPSAAWITARNLTLGAVGVVFLFYAALAIASIWNFVGNDVMFKSTQSMGLLFVSAVIMLVAFRSQQQ